MDNKKNSGNRNTGYFNTGSRNSGSRNTGDSNTGDFNKGYRNTGNSNAGDSNTGYSNTGYFNPGNRNSGNRNTGDFNTGNRNTGYFNNNTPRVRLFNKESDIEFGSFEERNMYSKIIKYQGPLCEWVSSINMTDEEKEDNPEWETTQGYLKVNKNTFNGNKVSEEDEAFFRALPNFDEGIFKECTGIDLSSKTVKITIDGKDIRISKDEFENIKRQFCD